MNIILDRRIHQYSLPEELYIITAGNPTDENSDGIDYQVNTMNYALHNLFTDLRLDPDPEEWLDWAIQEFEYVDANTSTPLYIRPNIHEDISEFIATNPELLSFVENSSIR
ncbi:hypothetical protein FPHOBKDP_00014 [Listeria phage LPJP1]|nr:hypothetical protein FPHOBKDP_00014 [Listeria phage LPJP1]